MLQIPVSASLLYCSPLMVMKNKTSCQPNIFKQISSRMKYFRQRYPSNVKKTPFQAAALILLIFSGVAFPGQLIAEKKIIRPKIIKSVRIHPIIIKNNLGEFPNKAAAIKPFKPQEKQYVYSILIDSPVSFSSSSSTLKKLSQLKSLGLSCRVSQKDTGTSEMQQKQLNILCGKAKTINELHDTITIALKNHLKFHVTLTLLPVETL